MDSYAPLSGDFILPFNMLSRYIRGRVISLGGVAEEIVSRRDYPDAVCHLLGEALALSAGLASTLKFDGTFSVRTRSDGPISMLLADVTNAGDMRAYARYDADALAAALAAAPAVNEDAPSLPRLLGAGHIAFTVDRKDGKAPYQGIVDLAGPTLADCAHAYFQNSEQLDCAIMLAAGRPEGAAGWRAGCLLLERLPAEDGTDDAELERRDEDWRRAVILLGTCTREELLDPALAKETLLHRLFHEEGLRVMGPRGLAARCRCSRERIEGVLASFDPAELEDMKEDGQLTVTCEFCGQDYAFDDADLASAAAGEPEGRST